MTPQQSQLVLFAVLIGVFYFLLIRPQQQRVKAHQKLVSELKVGDKVVTIGGIHGTITALKEDTIMLKVADKVIVELSRSAVGRKQGTPEK
jgi:preprotein translocase subunit YajC